MTIDTISIFVLTHVDSNTYVLLKRSDKGFSPFVASFVSPRERPLDVVKNHFKEVVNRDFPLLERVRPKGVRRPFVPYTNYKTTRVYCSFMSVQHNPEVYENNSTQWVKVQHLFDESFPWSNKWFRKYWLEVADKILERFFVKN